MRAKLEAVQSLWRTLGIISVLLALASAYALTDIDKHKVVDELSRFEAGFDADVVSQTLTQTARNQATLTLAAVAVNISGPGVPEVLPGESTIPPFGEMRVATLQDAYALRSESTTTLHRLDADTLAKALSFRLARQAERGPLTLTKLELMPTLAKRDASDRLLAAEAARRASVAARRNLVAAQGAAERQEELYEQRRKWKASRKVMQRSWEKMTEARATRKTETDAWESAFEQYQAAADTALVPVKPAKQGMPLGDMALAIATLKPVGEGEEFTLRVPVPVDAVEVALPSLSGVQFELTRAMGLWGEVKTMQPSAAVAHAEKTFGWMSRGIHVGPIRLSGLLALQLAAAALPLLLLLLIARCQAVKQSYNPFGQAEKLPGVGTGLSPVDFALLSPLPTLAAALATWSLFGLGQLPLLALPATLAALGLGIRAHSAILELGELKDAVMRSSVPPALSDSAVKKGA